MMNRAWLFASLLCALGAGSLGCGGARARPSSVLKPVEERRARGLVEQALLDNGATPAKGRVVKLPAGVAITEDMAIEGEVYGIAYLTEAEAATLGDAVPAYRPDAELRLVQGTGGEIVLVLYEQDYRYDAGDVHATSIVTAEKKLIRDVSDFVVHVVKQRKKP